MSVDPRVLNLSPFIAHFEVCKKDGNFYVVFLGDQKMGLVKDSKSLKFTEWSEYLKSVSILNKEVYSKKNKRSKIVRLSECISLVPDSVSGKWMRVKCKRGCKRVGEKSIGWVKWYERGKEIVDFRYVC